jgi:DNA invertase Pin-like site-specific DNA recombinase
MTENNPSMPGPKNEAQPMHLRPPRAQRRSRVLAYEQLATEPVPGTEGIVLYLRRSKFHGDVADTIVRQEARILEKYPPSRYTVMAIYRDNDPASGDVSAKRQGYRRLLRDLDAGVLADVKIVVWKRDRVDRVAWAQMKFVADASTKALGICSIEDGNAELEALSTAGKVMTALLAALAEVESDQTKSRVVDKKLATAEAGFNHGGQTPFGWVTTGEKITSHLGLVGSRLAAHPLEHPALKAAVEMVLSGHSLGEVANYWRDTLGIAAANRSPLKTANISRMLHSPRLMGYRMRKVPEFKRGQQLDLMEYVARHDADVVGVCSCHVCWDNGPRYVPGETLHRAGEPIAAAEAVCDPDTWLDLQQALTLRGRQERRAAWGSNEWLLSGLLVCAQCGRAMYGYQKNNRDKKTYGYRCETNRHVAPGTCAGTSIAGPALERYVVGFVMRVMTDERLLAMTAEAKDSLEVRAEDPRRAKLLSKKAELAILEERRASGAYEGEKFGRYLEKQERLLDELEVLSREVELTTASAVRPPASTRDELLRKFSTGSIGQKRALLATAIERIVIGRSHRAPGEPCTFQSDRIDIRLR